MTEKKILVVDDSATIRKLVDTHLSTAGYNVTLAPNAEVGLELADQIRPDLILLDHQLPGTTGYEVCQQLVASPDLAQIPVVISSTLRKKAYVEYADLDNVVDMLPKPYTEDLLITTVSNAIETAAMVLASQSKGSAVPEIIGDATEADLSGTFAVLGLRELIDFLNNGNQQGVLEVEAERLRVWIYLDEGRIQSMSASGLTAEEVNRMSHQLPESLANLAEILKLTIAGRASSEFDSFVKLLDRRVLDPRLTTKLLRFQAAMLMGILFGRKLLAFQFRSTQQSLGAHQNLPLDISLLALLVEHSLHCREDDLAEELPNQVYTRRTIRGQNLDRAGLSAQHMKLMNLLSEPMSIDQLATRNQCSRDEIRRVLNGFVHAGLLERTEETARSSFAVYEPNTTIAGNVRAALNEHTEQFAGKVVRDLLTLQLLVKRSPPDALFLAIDSPAACKPMHDALAAYTDTLAPTRKVILVPQQAADDDRIKWSKLLGFEPDAIIACPYTPEMLIAAMAQTSATQPTEQAEPEQAHSEVFASILPEPEMNVTGIEETV